MRDTGFRAHRAYLMSGTRDRNPTRQRHRPSVSTGTSAVHRLTGEVSGRRMLGVFAARRLYHPQSVKGFISCASPHARIGTDRGEARHCADFPPAGACQAQHHAQHLCAPVRHRRPRNCQRDRRSWDQKANNERPDFMFRCQSGANFGFSASTGFARSLVSNAGGVAEWLKAPVLKTGRRETVSWVRIPPPPPSSRCIKTISCLSSQNSNSVRRLRGLPACGLRDGSRKTPLMPLSGHGTDQSLLAALV